MVDPRGRGSSLGLRDIRGAVYIPQKDWNTYQVWANYDRTTVEREVGYAARLGLNSLRVWSSYEFWREDAATLFDRTEHFLATCERHDVRPLFVLFEAPPKDPPTEENLRNTDPASAFGVHSPSRPEILRRRNWKGYDGSPIQFARRFAEQFAEDDRVLATEVMNEPGDVQPRKRFVFDALDCVREAAPNATLTMGTKDVRYAKLYDRDGDLDVYQFHMNIPENPTEAELYVARQRGLADQSDDGPKPLWCTEWQRTLEEPPSRFAPNLASLAPTIRAATDIGTLDGDYFWSLMLKPAYLKRPRERGRINGLFHDDGAVYSKADAAAAATGDSGSPGRREEGDSAETDGFAALSDFDGGVPDPRLGDVDIPERHEFPSSWKSHPFPYPEPEPVQFGVSGASESSDRSVDPSNSSVDSTPVESDSVARAESHAVPQTDAERESFLRRLFDVLNFREKR